MPPSRLERIYIQEPTEENFGDLQTARIRAGHQQFYHDCDACILMESNLAEEYDYYYCPRSASSAGGSLLARFGSEGSKYASYPVRTARQIELGSRRGEAPYVDVRGLKVAVVDLPIKLLKLGREHRFVASVFTEARCQHGNMKRWVYEHGGCPVCPPPVACGCPDCEIPFA